LLFIAVALAIIPKWVERVRSKSNEISRSRAMENLLEDTKICTSRACWNERRGLPKPLDAPACGVDLI